MEDMTKEEVTHVDYGILLSWLKRRLLIQTMLSCNLNYW
jgi:hypothetical protein